MIAMIDYKMIAMIDYKMIAMNDQGLDDDMI
jgi:hypothetical protein